MELEGALKRRRFESVQYCLEALETMGADQRNQIRAADIIRSAQHPQLSQKIKIFVYGRSRTRLAERKRARGWI